MRVLIFLFLLTAAPAACAAEAMTVAAILPDARLVLSDGRIIRLEAVGIPPAEPYRAAARAVLKNYCGAGTVTLIHNAIDRYGDTTAMLTAGGRTLSAAAALVKAGAAFIFPPLGAEPELPQLFILEREARAARRGLWADAAYADMSPDEAADALGRFAFVRGKVLDAARVKDKFYLNFGADWHDDFTVAIAARDLRLFAAAGIDLAKLKDKIIRVRGMVAPMFGPMITLTSPSQLEILSSPEGSKP